MDYFKLVIQLLVASGVDSNFGIITSSLLLQLRDRIAQTRDLTNQYKHVLKSLKILLIDFGP